jgi:hypothetical protein
LEAAVLTDRIGVKKTEFMENGAGNMRAIVYTAIFGAYDDLKQPAPQNEECDFICFTDSGLPPRVGAWSVIRVRPSGRLHPPMQAKKFKLLSHKVFPNGRLALRYAPLSLRRPCDMSIWVDGSFQIKSPDFVGSMRSALGGQDWAMFAHPHRNCI